MKEFLKEKDLEARIESEAKGMKHYITRYIENGSEYAEAWSQINIFGKRFCFWKRRIKL